MLKKFIIDPVQSFIYINIGLIALLDGLPWGGVIACVCLKIWSLNYGCVIIWVENDIN